MTEDQEDPIVCCICGKQCDEHYFMCDEEGGEWCPECFDLTPCGRGEHGEGCPTQVFSGD